MPVLTVFAGPNGSGKSSIVRALDFEGRQNLLDADAIAMRINPNDPRQAAVAAGREVVRLTREYIEIRKSFAVETTLSGSTRLNFLRRASERAFIVRLVVICLDNPERCIQRVRERVSQGGHDVSDEDIRRRYSRSLANMPVALRFVDQAIIYDNSEAKPQKVLETRAGVITWRGTKEPAWVTRVINEMSGNSIR